MRISEAEEALRESDGRHKKELKSMKKETEKAIEEITRSHVQQLEQLQFE